MIMMQNKLVMGGRCAHILSITVERPGAEVTASAARGSMLSYSLRGATVEGLALRSSLTCARHTLSWRRMQYYCGGKVGDRLTPLYGDGGNNCAGTMGGPSARREELRCVWVEECAHGGLGRRPGFFLSHAQTHVRVINLLRTPKGFIRQFYYEAWDVFYRFALKRPTLGKLICLCATRWTRVDATNRSCTYRGPSF